MNNKIKIVNLVNKYSNNKILRAGVNAIPYIGGSLDILLTSDIQRKSQERFLNFLNELESQIKKIDEKKIDNEFLKSEEFYDLFIQSSNLAVRTRLHEKTKAYAKILTSSLTSKFDTNINAEDILNIVEGLTENDIKLIRLITEYSKLKDAEKMSSEIVFGAGSFYKISKDYKSDLILVGLLRLIKSSLVVKHHVRSATLKHSRFTITPMFNIVKEFISK